jgi:hypothetical protein
MDNFVTEADYRGSVLEKSFVKKQPTFQEMEITVKSNFEKGLITEEEFNKALETIDLLKGGEGSRGGKVIGHTKSGKPIYDKFNHPSHANFTSKDHDDAFGAHGRNHSNEEASKHLEKHYEIGKKDRQETLEKIKASHEGGKVGTNKLGKTASGKDVYDSVSSKNHSDFSSQDHLDAQKVNEDKMKEMESKFGEHSRHSPEYQKLYDAADNHWRKAMTIKNKEKKSQSQTPEQISKTKETASNKKKEMDSKTEPSDEEKSLSKEKASELIESHVNHSYNHADNAEAHKENYGETDHDSKAKSKFHWDKAKKLAKHHGLDFKKFA